MTLRRLFFLLFVLLFQTGISAGQIILPAWKTIRSGLEATAVPFSFEVNCGDSLVRLFRIEKKAACLRLACAAILDNQASTAPGWAEKGGFDLVFNAGMYLPGTMKAAGRMAVKGTLIQAKENPNFGAWFQLDGQGRQGFALQDKSCHPARPDSGVFASRFECMRMLDCNGMPVSWNKKRQSCSMLVAAEDSAGNFILAFCRSPMSQNQMAKFLARLPLGLRSALYLEGGPETSLFIKAPSGDISLVGTYVSGTWERCDNREFRRLPNAVGIKFPD